MYRFYFWFDNVPENRPGGPWWYRDFETIVARRDFVNDTRKFLKAWAYSEGEERDPDLMNIRPPDDVLIFEKEV